MPMEIVVPEFGESVVEATVGRWLKAEGEAVAAGEPVVELETEKVNTQVSAQDVGVLKQILRQEGDTVHPGEVLALLEGGSLPKIATAAAPGAAAAWDTPSRVAREESSPGGKVAASPLALKMAAESGVELAQLRGTGPGGRVMKEDVEAFLRQNPSLEEGREVAPRHSEGTIVPPTATIQPSAAIQVDREEVRQRMSRRRLTIARRLVEAQQTAAMLTTFNEIDMSAVIEVRRKHRESFRKSTGSDLGYMSFFVKAVVGALKAFPQLNAEVQGEELVLKRYYDIGIALGDPEGLVVPVLRDADRKGFAQIEQEIAGFVQKAGNRTLSLEDLRGGTFSITNGGVFGSLLSTPILNPPQVGILGMHRIQERPVGLNGEIVLRPMMYAAVTYDHRVVDGRESVLFLARIKELVEDPSRLLLDL